MSLCWRIFNAGGYSMLENYNGLVGDFECTLIKSWSLIIYCYCCCVCCQGSLHFTPTTKFLSFLGQGVLFCLFYFGRESILKRESRTHHTCISCWFFSISFLSLQPFFSSAFPSTTCFHCTKPQEKRYGSGIDFCSWTLLLIQCMH